jgi:hypothetical protein
LRPFAPEQAENRFPQRYTGEMDLKLVSRTLILAVAGGSFALTAFAQWQWIDKDGRKVYSDRSPSSDIPEKNILKRPGNAKIVVAPITNDDPAVTGPEPGVSPGAKKNGNAPAISGKDAQLEAKKKQAEEEVAAKRKADEERIAKTKAENCERAKKGIANLQSGNRISVTNDKGEQEVLDDKGRAAETRRLQAAAENNCSK